MPAQEVANQQDSQVHWRQMCVADAQGQLGQIWRNFPAAEVSPDG
jgi:hypothetical protein